MINLKELHTDDLSMNSGKLFREQMINNFKAIEQEINDLDKRITKLEDEKREGIDTINDMFNM